MVIEGICKRDQGLPGSGHQSIPLSEVAEILRLRIGLCQEQSVCPFEFATPSYLSELPEYANIARNKT